MKTTQQIICSFTRTKVLALTLVFAAVAFSCDDENDDNGPAQQTVLEIAVANNDFDVLAAAATRAGSGVTNVLSGSTQITVFAPTDAAFIALLDADNEAEAIAEVTDMDAEDVADLLTFHVIAGSEIKAAAINSGTTTVTTARAENNKAFVTKTGSSVTINNARVTIPDVDASNGVIHGIDAVLTPPTGDVVAIAVADDRFDILAAAVTEAGLAVTLQGNGPLTVFAPTDDAFLELLRLPAFFGPELSEQGAINFLNNTISETSETLNLPTLRSILTYHVVNGSAYSINLTNNQVLTTLKASAPNTLTVGLGSSVTIDGLGSTPSTVVLANVSATNGVVHAINKVLLFQ